MKRPCVLALLTLLNVSFVLGKSVHFLDCGSKESSISQVNVTPCQAEPCQLKKGVNESVEVIFKPNEQIGFKNVVFALAGPDIEPAEVVTGATVVVHGIIEGVPVPFPISQPDGCKEHGLDCPLQPNKEYTFKATLPVKRVYPDLRLVVKWELHDQNGNSIFCWELPVQIVG